MLSSKWVIGISIVSALLVALAGNAREEEVDLQELYDLCSRFPLNSRCEGLEIPIPLDERIGTDASCSISPLDWASSDRCKLRFDEAGLTVFYEEGDEIEFLGDRRGTRELNIPFDRMLAFDLKFWDSRSDAASIFIGGKLYAQLNEDEFEGFEREFDPTENANERTRFGSDDFAETEILFSQISDAENQFYVLAIASTEELGTFLRSYIEPHLRSPLDDDLNAVETSEEIEPNPTNGLSPVVLTEEPEIDRVELIDRLLDDKECVRCNLQGVDLSGANLDEANLEGVNLQGANLSNADLEECYLVGANLDGAILSGADLSSARLMLASFEGASLDEIDLDAASLQYANLSDANLTNAQMSGTNLEWANLSGAILENADLSDVTTVRSFVPFWGIQRYRIFTSLENANFSGANLSNATLEDARANGVDFSGANLSGANLDDISLIDANLSGANLSGAEIDDDTDLTYTNLCGATMPDNTVSEVGCP